LACDEEGGGPGVSWLVHFHPWIVEEKLNDLFGCWSLKDLSLYLEDQGENYAIFERQEKKRKKEEKTSAHDAILCLCRFCLNQERKTKRKFNTKVRNVVGEERRGERRGERKTKSWASGPGLYNQYTKKERRKGIRISLPSHSYQANGDAPGERVPAGFLVGGMALKLAHAFDSIMGGDKLWEEKRDRS